MRRRVLLCWLILLSVGLVGQSGDNRPAELPPGSVTMEDGYADNADNRLLTAVYRTINYPREARDYGVTGTVLAIATIDSLGQLTVTDTQFRTPKQMDDQPIRVRETDLIRVVGYSTGGNSLIVGKIHPKRVARGGAALCKEVARTLSSLPTFTPALREGSAVPERIVKVIVFSLE
ncbi:hypothetical protein [Lewinella sp. JB7]|uniref:hypothetical protein n=1 Tax=Lewinella sp. JB7 TaxID=2962887 RepID=UPI0020C998F6|nr:hypothetical protein [Lewinella sp. JB7]MCP9236525.1 hypothetical protein [Lewinella sp. JB7]